MTANNDYNNHFDNETLKYGVQKKKLRKDKIYQTHYMPIYNAFLRNKAISKLIALMDINTEYSNQDVFFEDIITGIMTNEKNCTWLIFAHSSIMDIPLFLALLLNYAKKQKQRTYEMHELVSRLYTIVGPVAVKHYKKFLMAKSMSHLLKTRPNAPKTERENTTTVDFSSIRKIERGFLKELFKTLDIPHGKGIALAAAGTSTVKDEKGNIILPDDTFGNIQSGYAMVNKTGGDIFMISLHDGALSQEGNGFTKKAPVNIVIEKIHKDLFETLYKNKEIQKHLAKNIIDSSTGKSVGIVASPLEFKKQKELERKTGKYGK